jgi:hypothetical protein
LQPEKDKKEDNINPSLNPRKWSQGKIISSVVLVAAMMIAGFSFILKKQIKNDVRRGKKKKIGGNG